MQAQCSVHPEDVRKGSLSGVERLEYLLGEAIKNRSAPYHAEDLVRRDSVGAVAACNRVVRNAEGKIDIQATFARAGVERKDTTLGMRAGWL